MTGDKFMLANLETSIYMLASLIWVTQTGKKNKFLIADIIKTEAYLENVL